MRKMNNRLLVTAISVICAFVIGLSACGQTRNAGFSDRGYELACAALEITNDYIDRKIDADAALDKLSNVYTSLKVICDKVREQNDGLIAKTDVWRDGNAESSVLIIQHEIMMHSFGTNPMSEVEEARDSLQKLLWS